MPPEDMFIDIDAMSVLVAVKMTKMRAIIERTLAQLGLGKQIYYAESGAEALGQLKTTRVDIVLIDHDLTGINREPLADAMKKVPGLKHVPVIFLIPEPEKAKPEKERVSISPPLVPAVMDEKIRRIVNEFNLPDEATRLARRADEYEEKKNLAAAVRYMRTAVRLKPDNRFMAKELTRLKALTGYDDSEEEPDPASERPEKPVRRPGEMEASVFIEIDTMSILIVDNAKNMRTIIKRTLNSLGLGKTYHFAENGSRALKLMKDCHVDFVISAWQMPVMNGKLLLTAMGRDKKLRDVPILILPTDRAEEATAIEFRTPGSYFLSKPLVPARLEDKIRSAVSAVNFPDEAACLARKARDYEDEGNPAAAIRYLKTALRLKPDDSPMKRELSQLYIKAGKHDRAKALEHSRPTAVMASGPVPVQAQHIEMEDMSVLIVDDLKSTRTMIKKIMKKLGLGKEFHYAQNGSEALEILKTCDVDIVISDWQMPVMNGKQLLAAMKEDKKLRDIPVLILTADSEEEMRMDVADTRVDAYLPKPVKPQVLESRIRSVVEDFNYPDEAAVLTRKARDYEEKGNLKSAIRYMQAAVRIAPGDARLLKKLSRLFADDDNAENSEEALLKTVEVDPDDAVSHFLVTQLHWKKQNWEEAVSAGIRTLRLTHKFNTEMFEYGKGLLQRGHNELAVTLFERIIIKTKKGFPLKKQILDLCIEKDEINYAKTLVHELLREFPANHELLYSAGLVYDTLNDHDKALEYYLKADEKNVNPFETKMRLARIYSIRQESEKAEKYLAQVF